LSEQKLEQRCRLLLLSSLRAVAQVLLMPSELTQQPARQASSLPVSLRRFDLRTLAHFNFHDQGMATRQLLPLPWLFLPPRSVPVRDGRPGQEVQDLANCRAMVYSEAPLFDGPRSPFSFRGMYPSTTHKLWSLLIAQSPYFPVQFRWIHSSSFSSG
jgi:hypothetical protein